MFVSKMGSYHKEYGINNHDSGFEYKNIRCVVDGCSEGLHSEVGAKLYTKKLLEKIKSFENKDKVNRKVGLTELIEIFENVKNIIINSSKEVLYHDYEVYLNEMINYMCFTILYLEELEDSWQFYVCGDGFVIVEDNYNKIEFYDMGNSETPMYLSYSYIRRDCLKLPENIKLGFRIFNFSKKKYNSVGIATDGLKKIIGSDYEIEFKRLLKKRSEIGIKRKINQLNYQLREGGGFFKDDITISY